MLQPGDRALIKKIHGNKLLQEGICWWTNSQFSHIEPVVDYDGSSIDITCPRAVKSNIHKYLDGNWRVVIIRPVPGFDNERLSKWITAILALEGLGYDLLSFLGFLTNKRIQDKRKIECAEGVLMADKAVGLFPLHDGYFASPQTYWDFTTAGAFEIVRDW